MQVLWKGLASIVIGVCLLGTAPAAQCPLPDGLDGGACCTAVNARIPALPGFSMDSLDICWRDCDVDALFTCRAEWKVLPFIRIGPVPIGQTDCGQRRMVLSLIDSAGDVKYRGLMRLTYSRTWVEVDTAGNQYQVWRFIVNGDLRNGPAAGLTPCPTPPCAASFGNKVRYTGYIDWAKDCSTGTFQNAWMLTHQCDVIDHQPGFPRSGFFHPNRAYTLVGPAAGFAVGPIQPIVSGGSTSEAVRRLRLPPPGVNGVTRCESEEFIDTALDPIQELCLCGLPLGPLQYAISDLGLASSCGTTLCSPGGPFLPGYISMGIGAWTSTTAYPGLESLRWNGGGYDYFDPCTGVTRQEVFFGVTTNGGFFAAQLLNSGVGFPLALGFVDQVNSLNHLNATTMNIPFRRSDHILNLNF